MIGFLPYNWKFSRGIGFDLVAAEIDWIDTLFRSANDSLWTLIPTIFQILWGFVITFLVFSSSTWNWGNPELRFIFLGSRDKNSNWSNQVYHSKWNQIHTIESKILTYLQDTKLNLKLDFQETDFLDTFHVHTYVYSDLSTISAHLGAASIPQTSTRELLSKLQLLN